MRPRANENTGCDTASPWVVVLGGGIQGGNLPWFHPSTGEVCTVSLLLGKLSGRRRKRNCPQAVSTEHVVFFLKDEYHQQMKQGSLLVMFRQRHRTGRSQCLLRNAV